MFTRGNGDPPRPFIEETFYVGEETFSVSQVCGVSQSQKAGSCVAKASPARHAGKRRRACRLPCRRRPLRGEAEDPFDRVHSAELRDGQATGYSATDLPASAFSHGGSEALASGAAKADSAADRPRDKIHPELRGKMAAAGFAAAEQTVIVTFRDAIALAIEPCQNEPSSRRLPFIAR
jgi:hypothetical protein